MNVEVEVWKTIDGYEDYQVSNLGRVKSFKKFFGTNEHILKACSDGTGYLQLRLLKHKNRKTFKVHVLVAMMFHGHKPDGTHKVVVDHIDNNKINNRADNLQLITSRENASKDRKGRISKYIGVIFHKKNKKWRSCILYQKRHINIGCFDIEIDASNAYNKALNQINQGLDLNVLYPKKTKSSKYKYVSYNKKDKLWMVKYKNKYIGSYKTEEEAYELLQNYIKQLNENKKL